MDLMLLYEDIYLLMNIAMHTKTLAISVTMATKRKTLTLSLTHRCTTNYAGIQFFIYVNL